MTRGRITTKVRKWNLRIRQDQPKSEKSGVLAYILKTRHFQCKSGLRRVFTDMNLGVNQHLRDRHRTRVSGQRSQLVLDLATCPLKLQQVGWSGSLLALLFGESASLTRAVDVQPRDRRVSGESNGSLKLLIATEAQRYRRGCRKVQSQVTGHRNA